MNAKEPYPFSGSGANESNHGSPRSSNRHHAAASTTSSVTSWALPMCSRTEPSDRSLLPADEPNRALDSTNGGSMMRTLRKACREGVPSVVVTHYAQLSSWADRVAIARDGRVVDQTPPRPSTESLLELSRRP